ncbi:MAG: OB-fold nucleic acid binding domain-containing protein, partial [Pirellulaceae bacterium]
MSRLFVNQLADGQGVDEVFLASEKQLRPNRAGQLYLQVRLSDKTGSLTAMLWNANQGQFDSFSNGDFVRVQGTSQLYNGGMQIIVQEIDPADTNKVDDSHFITMSSARIEKLTHRLGEMIGQIRNVHLRKLGQAFLDDPEFMTRFRKAPAGVKNHHAYHGGLLEHVVSVMDLAVFVGDRYDRLDPDLLIMGAFLHDAG